MNQVVVMGGSGNAGCTVVRDLMSEVYPDVPLREVEGHETLLSIEKARRMLGYDPKHSWRGSV